MKINLSFKNNDAERSIYFFVKSKMNYSVYIKELIIADMKSDIADKVK